MLYLIERDNCDVIRPDVSVADSCFLEVSEGINQLPEVEEFILSDDLFILGFQHWLGNTFSLGYSLTRGGWLYKTGVDRVSAGVNFVKISALQSFEDEIVKSFVNIFINTVIVGLSILFCEGKGVMLLEHSGWFVINFVSKVFLLLSVFTSCYLEEQIFFLRFRIE